MKSKVNYIIVFLCCFGFSGCVSEFNADLPSDDVEMLVVEGNIVANSQSVFYLEKSFSLNEPKIPASSLEVRAELVVVGSNGYKSDPATYLGAGKYQVGIGNLDDDQSYGIEINYNGDVYASELLPPLVTPEIDSVSWKQVEKEGMVTFHVSTHDINNKAGFYIWNYVEDWEIKSLYETSLFFDPNTSTYYYDDSFAYLYCWKKNEINPILVGSSESLKENRIVNKQLYEQYPNDDRYSELYSVKVTQQSLTKAAYEYYSNKAKLNDDVGGIFTPQPSEIKGNIECRTNSSKKVMGFTSVLKNLSEKRIYIEKKQISRNPTSDCDAIPASQLREYLYERQWKLIDLYLEGYRPVARISPDSEENPADAWVKEACTDCTKKRGSKTKPDFWPNDHK